MIIPLRTDSPLRNTPYMNWALILANVAIFALTRSNPALTEPYILSARQPQLFQFISYQFLHADIMHIVGNMLFLYIFGNNVNDRLGHVGFLALYLAGGVFAGLSYVITSNGWAGLLGASGSIATITGAYLVLLPRSNITILYFIYLVGVTEIASHWFILGFFAYDIFANFSMQDSVGHTAHIGGTVFGAGMCMALLLMHLLPRDPFDVVAMVDRWNRRRQYRDMVASGYNPFEYTQPTRIGLFGRAAPPPLPPDPKTQRVMDQRSRISEAVALHDLDRAAPLYLELKQLDPTQVLPRQQQLDVANHLAHQQHFPQAAEAYELYLQHYPKAERLGEVELMLGLIYARYLGKPEAARLYLTRAAARYHTGRELELAREELARLGPA